MKRFFSFKSNRNSRPKESLLFIAAGIFLLNFYGCNKNLSNADNSKLVLEGYLFQGEVVDSVHGDSPGQEEYSDSGHNRFGEALTLFHQVAWQNMENIKLRFIK
jgi:hypothetical protein